MDQMLLANLIKTSFLAVGYLFCPISKKYKEQ